MDFQNAVIDKSFEQPVLVDFWAPWCGPCQFLGPVLEEMEKEQTEWSLVKINVDENQEVSARYGIRGIPDVRLFSKGNAIASFTGALPRHQIERWLEQHLPDKRNEILEHILDLEDDNEKINQLESLVTQDPDFNPARTALSGLIIWGNPEKARELIENISMADKDFENVVYLLQLANFMLFNPSDQSQVAKKVKKVQDYWKRKEYEAGVKVLIEAVIIDKNYEEDLPRKTAIAFFNFLGKEHSLTIEYRKQFDMALY